MIEQDEVVEARIRMAVMAERARCAAIAGGMRDKVVEDHGDPLLADAAEALRVSILQDSAESAPVGRLPTEAMLLAAYHVYVTTLADSPGRMRAAIVAALALDPRRPAPDDLEHATGPQVMCDGRGRPVAVVAEDGTRWTLTKA